MIPIPIDNLVQRMYNRYIKSEGDKKMFEIYNVYTGVTILSGLTFKQAFNLRMMQADRLDLAIRETKS